MQISNITSLSGVTNVAPPEKLEEWTLAIIPDTQYFTFAGRINHFQTQVDWLVANKTALNIKHAVHLGDLTESGSNSTEWGKAQTAMRTLDGEIPYTVCIGNHDYNDVGLGGTSRLTSYFESYFPKSHYENDDSFGGSYDETMLNTYSIISADRDYIILNLEFLARAEILVWADGVCQANKDKKIIVITHGHLMSTIDYNYRDTEGLWDSREVDTPFHFCKPYSGSGDCSDSIEVERFLARNSNIMMLLNGHALSRDDGGDGATTDFASDYRISRSGIHEIMTNWQNVTDYPYIRYITFKPKSSQMDIKTYCPTNDTFLTDSEYQYTLNY